MIVYSLLFAVGPTAPLPRNSFNGLFSYFLLLFFFILADERFMKMRVDGVQ